MIACALGLILSTAAGSHAEVRGTKIYYEIHGQGRPVVLLHGGLGTVQTSFAKILPDLERNHRVIGIEQRGHGHTRDVEGPYAYDQQAEDAVAVLSAIGVTRADLIGFSDGAILALLIAARHPTLARKIVASGPNLRADGIEPEALRWMQNATPEEFRARMSGGGRREAYEAASPDGAAHWAVVSEKVRSLWIHDGPVTAVDLRRIDAPAMLVFGDHDTIRLEHALEIFRPIPHAQLLVLPETGHDTFNLRGALVASLILPFLDAPTPADVVQAEVDAYNAQDVEAFAATYAEDAVVTRGAEKKVFLQGRGAIREWYGAMFAKYRRCRARIVERRTEGGVVLDHEVITGRGPEHPDPWDVGWVRNVVENGMVTRVELP